MSRNREFEDLKKHTFDNMSVYLAKKEERIKEQKAKRSSQQAIVEEGSSGIREYPDSKDAHLTTKHSTSPVLNTRPPEKKLKTDNLDS